MMTKQLTEAKVQIRCINCLQKIESVLICEMDSIIGKRYAFFCSQCQKFIGISASRDKYSPISQQGSNTVYNA
jgi:hypothetical protein